MAHERTEILRSRGRTAHQKLWHDDRLGGRGSLLVAFEVRQDLGRGCMELEEGEQDGMNLSSELSGGRNDDGANVVSLGGLVEA